MSYYAVQKGRGGAAIYRTWNECKEATHGFPGAKFKKFDIEKDAKAYAFGKKPHPDSKYDIVLYTDGSYLSFGVSGYAAVFVQNGEAVAVLYGPCSKPDSIHNVGSEIEAAERGIAVAMEKGFRSIKVCHDYEGIGAWADRDWQTKKETTIEYREFVDAARKKVKIDFQKVRGHSGDKFNDMADEYANFGAEQTEEVFKAFCDFDAKESLQKNPDSSKKPRKTYVCPECGRRVAKNANVCTGCGIIFDETTKPVEKQSPKETAVDSKNCKPESKSCPVCGKEIGSEGSVWTAKVLDVHNQKPVLSEKDFCSEKCAKDFVDKQLDWLSEIYDEISSQKIEKKGV